MSHGVLDGAQFFFDLCARVQINSLFLKLSVQSARHKMQLQ